MYIHHAYNLFMPINCKNGACIIECVTYVYQCSKSLPYMCRPSQLLSSFLHHSNPLVVQKVFGYCFLF